MKKLSLLIFMATVCGTARAQHLPNGNFEVWKQACGNTYQSSPTDGGPSGTPAGDRQRPGQEPEFWNGSSINQKVLMEKKETLITKEDNNGSSVVKMENKFVGVWSIGSNAPAFITFATPWVYAITNISNCDGGAYGGMTFGFRPDAIRGVYKRTTGSDGEEKAHIIAYLWKGTYTSKIVSVAANEDDKIREDVDRVIMKKAEPITAGTLIASCDYEFTSTANNDWEEIIVPLVYEPGQENVIPEKMNVVLSSADYWTRSNIKKGNILEADDVDFVYYSQLASLSYNGTPVAGFDKDVYAYTVQGDYTDGCLEAVKNCMGGTCTIGAYDEANKTVTITVKGDDWSEANKNEHSYVVTFVEAQPEVTEYTNLLTVSIDGVTTAPQETTIQLIKELDGSYSFALNNFMLDGGDGSIMPVGNIKLNNLAIDSSVFTANQVIRITPGTPEDAGWIGPYLEDVPVALKAELIDGNMVADIDIDMTALLGQSIKVVFAPSVVLKDTEAFGTSVIPVTRTYKDKLTVTIDGSSADPQEAEIIVENLVDGTCNLSLKNFSLGMGADALPVGNINVKGLILTDCGGYKTFVTDQVIQITPGDPEDLSWLGPMLGDVPIKLIGKLTDEKLYCTIDIDMSEMLGQVIAVVFGNDFEGGVSLKNLKNVTLQRTFKAGWNTVCLPFDYSLITFGGNAKAQAFVSATAEGLNFESVEEMKANVPYLLYLPNDITTPLYFGVNVAPATPVAVTYGDFTFTGTYEPMSMAGKYGVATVDGVDKIVKGGANATVKGTRAYFTSTNADIKEMPLLIDGVATGVAGVQAAEDAAYDVYTLTGIQVRKGAATLGGLPKGIYIVNGKKMYIK